MCVDTTGGASSAYLLLCSMGALVALGFTQLGEAAELSIVGTGVGASSPSQAQSGRAGHAAAGIGTGADGYDLGGSGAVGPGLNGTSDTSGPPSWPGLTLGSRASAASSSAGNAGDNTRRGARSGSSGRGASSGSAESGGASGLSGFVKKATRVVSAPGGPHVEAGRKLVSWLTGGDDSESEPGAALGAAVGRAVALANAESHDEATRNRAAARSDSDGTGQTHLGLSHHAEAARQRQEREAQARAHREFVMAAFPANWSQPFGGLWWGHQDENTGMLGQNIHVAIIDLESAGVSVGVSGPEEPVQPVGAFAQKVGAQLAINANWFGPGAGVFDGIVVSDGHRFGGPDHGYTAMIGFGSDNRVQIDHHGEQPAHPPDWVQSAVSGHPTIVWDGKSLAASESGFHDDPTFSSRNPRTIIGASKDGRHLILVTVDGRQGGRGQGMNATEAADLMVGLGADRAVILDGGGSSTMWIEGHGVVNRPSDGTARPVGNQLVITAPHL